MKRQKDMNIGCVHKTNNYGYVEVVNYENSYNVSVRFVEDGTIVTTSANHIRNGRVKNPSSPSVCGVGFIGVGRHSAKRGCKSYERWLGMMRRCYAKDSNKNFKTYEEVSVCSEWHNFQNFAEWHEENYPKDGKAYDLDKDELSVGEKIYSPATCQFIPHERNMEISHAKNFAFMSPDGRVVKVFNLRKFCRENKLDNGEMSKVANGKILQHKGYQKHEIEVEV